MMVTQLTVADRDFYLAADQAQEVMQAAAAARANGDWLELQGVRGGVVHLLIPTQALVVIRQFDMGDDDSDDYTDDPNDWFSFDLEL